MSSAYPSDRPCSGSPLGSDGEHQDRSPATMLPTRQPAIPSTDSAACFSITRFAKKSGGSLTKRISITADGTLISDGSECLMTCGIARRVLLRSVHELANLIAALTSNEAIALGTLHESLPDTVEVTTKRRWERRGSNASGGIIPRTAHHLVYQPGQRGLALLDFDTKGMPEAIRRRLQADGGFWPLVSSVLPGLARAGRVFRQSTSAGLFRSNTNEPIGARDGMHVYVAVTDGEDIERFLKVLHDRCWLAGLGWYAVGKAGQLLERSIVDWTVGRPERLVFEGPPILVPPLAQDLAKRKPTAVDGLLLDTVASCPPLTILEKSRLKEMRIRAAHQLAHGCEAARRVYVSDEAKRISARAGVRPDQAIRTAEQRARNVLLPKALLQFDDPELDGTTVADILAEPARFEGETLADPLEGRDYGPCKAKVMLRRDGTAWIHSFAHGGATYELKWDADAVRTAIERADPDSAANEFVRLATNADLNPQEIETLRSIAANRGRIGLRVLDALLRAARKDHDRQAKEEIEQAKNVERRDPRPGLPVPAPEAPWLPQMQVINDVLGASHDPEPPVRDLEGHLCEVRERRALGLHLLTASSSERGQSAEPSQPVAEQPLLTRLSEAETAELIERHIDYHDKFGVSVHLPEAFVRHFMVRHDGALPTVTAVATLPQVLPDGRVLSGRGLRPECGIIFRVPAALEALLPTAEHCGPTEIARSMSFLVDDWLCDVATDYAGKCVLVAAALTILERLQLPERPAFFITAGHRASGKTTSANMVSAAVLGCRASAAAWSSNQEERRKAMLAYLTDGAALICWDNIPRGTALTCPSIEKALTAPTYIDRVLGRSETRTVPSTAVHLFTGNNIGPAGDMTSRALIARLSVDRPDPENRTFRHHDPIAWTDAHRHELLRALYVLLIGNPRLRHNVRGENETRFKHWWHLVGSAVEHAAQQHCEHARALALPTNDGCPPIQVRFRDLFMAGETEDEQAMALAALVQIVRTKWPTGCTAQQAAAYAGAADEGGIAFRTVIEQATQQPLRVVSAPSLTWRLKSLADAPVPVDGAILVLRYRRDHRGAMILVEKIG
jgi:hypothetical protein